MKLRSVVLVELQQSQYAQSILKKRASSGIVHHLGKYRGVDQKSVPAKPFGNVNNTVARVPGYRTKFSLAVKYPGNLFILTTESTVESEYKTLNNKISL